MDQGNQQWIGTLISFGLLALVLTLRLRRARAVRPLKVEQLWMLPAFYAVVVVLLYLAHPPVGITWAYAALALALGTGLGWYRGKLMTIAVDPQTQAVTQQGSMLAMLFILALVAVRFGLRYAMENGANFDPATTYVITDVALAFGLGFIAAQRLEMGLRARALLAAAKAGE